MHKLQVREKHAHDSAAKLRRSQRIAARQEANFLDMMTKAVRAKARRFNLTPASDALSAALAGSGLADNPDEPATSVPHLRAVAI